MQCALERAAVGAFGWLKPTLADERLDFAVAQLNGHADELVGTSTAAETLTFGGQMARKAGGRLLFHLVGRVCERTPIVTTKRAFG